MFVIIIRTSAYNSRHTFATYCVSYMYTIIIFAAGPPCRFDNSSTGRGTCIFPCRCTDGCDQVTGQCLDGGQCSDGHPIGYKWSGPACQI